MKPTVTASMGDVFEGGADLTVLPCGAKPTWTAAVDRWIEQFELPTPKQLASRMRLSDVTTPFPFPGPERLTRYVSYAASVFNGQTDPDAIRAIGNRLGEFTQAYDEINIVESVLLGTGHGKLDPARAARSLAKGFKEAAESDAALCIHIHGHDRYTVVVNALHHGFFGRIVDAVVISPEFMGVGLNIKKLFNFDK